MNKWKIVFVIAIAVGFLFSIKDMVLNYNKSEIGLIEIKGVLKDSQTYVDMIEKMRKRNSVKGVLIRIDSPGGGVVVAQEIYEAMKRLRKEKKVVVSMGSVAASGGYYIACGSDVIYANPGTVTGSIGVIMEYPQFEKLMKKIGVENVVVKTGKRKDAGNPFRELKPDERKYFENVLNEIFADFKNVVIKERKLENPPDSLFDGRIFTGRTAQRLGLIDSIGDFYNAKECLKRLCNIKGDVSVYKVEKKKGFLSLIADYTESYINIPVFSYLMKWSEN